MKQIIPFKKEITFKTMISKITSISLEHTLELKSEDMVTGDFIVSGSYKMTEASQIDEEFSYKIPIEITIDSKYDTSNIALEFDDFVYEVLDEERLLLNIDLCIDNLELKEEAKEEIDVISSYEDEYEELDNTLREIEEDIENDCLTRTEKEKEEESDLISLEEQSSSTTLNSNKVDTAAEVQPQDREIDTKDNIEQERNDSVVEAQREDLFKEVSSKEELEVPISINSITSSANQEMMPSYFNSTKEEVLDNDKTNPVSSIFSAFKDTDETFSTYCVYIIREGDSLDTVINKYKTTRDVLAEYNDLSDVRIGTKIIVPSISNEG